MARLCPHCDINSTFKRIIPFIDEKCNDKNGFHYIEQCHECNGIVYSIWNLDRNAPVVNCATNACADLVDETLIEKFSYPFRMVNPPIRISESFDKSFVEGVKCLNVDAPFASVVILENVCK